MSYSKEFIEFIQSHGFEPPKNIPIGQFIRFSTNNNKSDKAGWCYLFPDECGGILGDWRTNESYTWQANKPWTDEEKKSFHASVRLAKIAHQDSIVSNHKDSAKMAQQIWQESQSAIHHPYLTKKQIKPSGLKLDSDGRLIAPLFDINGNIQSLQFIDDNGTKRFLTGGKKKGGFFPMGDADGEQIFICEGIATGASIYEACGSHTIVAFDSGNLPHVAQIIRQKYPHHEIVIAGDDDFKNKINTGKVSAINTANLINAKVIFPKFSDPRSDNQTDFNDMAISEGVFVVGVHLSDIKHIKPLEPKKFDMGQFSLNGQSQVMLEQMLDDKYILGKMAILGQFVVFYAAPNVGKTLLVMHLLIKALENGDVNGSDIFYINADDHYKGLVSKLQLAEEYGFQMLAPGHNGFDSKKFEDYVKKMVSEGTAKGKVIILDTLKKFTDLMSKKFTTEFGKVMREFVSHGGTIIGLAHVNKHKNPDGKSIYSGTADITDDADCYYMIEEIQSTPLKKTVRFENKKSRGDVDKVATYVYTNQKVSNYQELLDSIQTLSEEEAKAIAEINETNAKLINNREGIDAITETIRGGLTLKTPLIKAVAEATSITSSKVKQILELHTGNNFKRGDRWYYSIGEKNARNYYLISPKGLEAEYRDLM